MTYFGLTFGRHGMPPPVSNNTGTALCQDGSDWSRDFATLTLKIAKSLGNIQGHEKWRPSIDHND